MGYCIIKCLFWGVDRDVCWFFFLGEGLGISVVLNGKFVGLEVFDCEVENELIVIFNLFLSVCFLFLRIWIKFLLLSICVRFVLLIL